MIPTVVTNDVMDVFPSSCTLNGNITSAGGETITTRGFVYIISATGDEIPRIGDLGVVEVSKSGSFAEGRFFGILTGLLSERRYRYCAFATNVDGISYGDTKDIYTIDTLVNTIPYSINNLIVWYVMARCMEQDRNIEASLFYMDLYNKEINYIIRGFVSE